MKNTWKNKIESEKICLNIEINLINKNMRKDHVREYGHVQRKVTNTAVKKSDFIQVWGNQKIYVDENRLKSNKKLVHMALEQE